MKEVYHSDDHVSCNSLELSCVRLLVVDFSSLTSIFLKKRLDIFGCIPILISFARKYCVTRVTVVMLLGCVCYEVTNNLLPLN